MGKNRNDFETLEALRPLSHTYRFVALKIRGDVDIRKNSSLMFNVELICMIDRFYRTEGDKQGSKFDRRSYSFFALKRFQNS